MPTYTGDVAMTADALATESVSYLPGENRGTHAFIVGDFVNNVGGRHPGLAAPNGLRSHGAGLVVAAEDLGDAPVGDLQDARDVARARSRLCQLDDAVTSHVGQRSTVDECATQLVHSRVTCAIQIHYKYIFPNCMMK